MTHRDPGARAGVYIDTSGEEPVLHDWRGNEVRAGDRVFYPCMSGRSCFIAEGVVLAMEPVASAVKEHKGYLKDARERLARDLIELEYTEDQLPETWQGRDPWTLETWRERCERSIKWERDRIAELEQPQEFPMKVVIKVERDNLHGVSYAGGNYTSSKRTKDTVSLTRYDNITRFP